MRLRRRLAARALAFFTVLWLAGAPGAQAASCGTDGCVLDMSPTLYVVNNEWGNIGYGAGSISSSSPTSWSTSWDYDPPTDWVIMSYPAAVLGWQWGYRLPNTGLPVQLSSRTPITTTAVFDYVPDASCGAWRLCRQDISYDVWLHDSANPGYSNPGLEMMIWVGYAREMFSGFQPQGYATLAGHSWKVLLTQGGASPVATFLLDEPADLTGVTLNITDFTDWLVAHGWVPGSWWVDGVQFGTEIIKGKGRLDVNYYSVVVGGPAPPPPPTGTPAASFTVGATGATPSPATPGQAVTLSTTVSAGAAAAGTIVDVGVRDAAGTRIVQQAYKNQAFSAGQTRTFSSPWTLPPSLPAGTYTITVTVFDSTWTTPYVTNNSAGTLSVQANAGAGGLTLSLSGSAFRTGDSTTVTLSAPDLGPGARVDVYFGVLLPPEAGPAVGCPQRDAALFVVDGYTGVSVACLSSAPSSFGRLYANAAPGSLARSLSFVWPPGMPAGRYVFFLALTWPEALADGVLDGRDVLAVVAPEVTFQP